MIYGVMITAFRMVKSAAEAVSERTGRVATSQHHEYTIEALRKRFKGKVFFSSRSLKAATEYWNGNCLWCGRNRIECMKRFDAGLHRHR
jgi:hypothetical protein